jgi:single-strand DNA-binding protein
MANLNKVLLIGRLTRDPEMRTFANGGKVARIGFAVNNRRKNTATGQWEDEPVFLDIEAFNRLEGGRQLADLVENYLRKGNQVFIEGHLQLDQWTSQDGQKRQKLKIVLDNLQFLEPKGDGVRGAPPRTAPPARSGDYDAPPMEPAGHEEPPPGGGEDNIPF